MNTKRLLHISLAMIFIPVLFGAGYFFAGHFFDNERDRMMQFAPECNLARAPCRLEDEILAIELEFEGAVRSGEPFTVVLTPDKPLDYVTVGFIQTDESTQSSPYEASYDASLGVWKRSGVVLESDDPSEINWEILIATRENGRHHFAQVPFSMND
ncbi:MAG: hypothetical protein P8Z78_02650 [Gammaproteobacteria bacterium]|jgi:hypothetical protein